MTEAEWLDCADSQRMLNEYLYLTGSVRKKRLFACACCRRVWHLLDDARCRTGVEVGEDYADGLVGVAKVKEALFATLRASDKVMVSRLIASLTLVL